MNHYATAILKYLLCSILFALSSFGYARTNCTTAYYSLKCWLHQQVVQQLMIVALQQNSSKTKHDVYWEFLAIFALAVE